MQRDGHSDDRPKTGPSGRTPPVIEGQAIEVAAAHADTPEAEAAALDAAAAHAAAAEHVEETRIVAEPADAVLEETHADGPEPEVSAPDDAIAAPPPPQRKRGSLLLPFGLIIVAFAGAIAWLATPGHREGDLKSRVIALLPQSAQRALHVAPASSPAATESKTEVGKADAPKPDSSSGDAVKTDASKTDASKTGASKTGASKTDVAKTDASTPDAAKSGATAPVPAAKEPERVAMGEPAKPSEPADKGAASTQAPATQQPPTAANPASQPGSMTVVGAPPLPTGVDARRIDDMSAQVDAVQAKVDGMQSKLDAALGRISDLQSKLELAQGKIELSQSKSDAASTADAVTQAAQKLDALTQKLAALDQKLEQPKTDTRAPQARENNAPTGREYAASRAVVAQATTEALRAGAPLADNLAALKGLGVADDKIADLSPFAKAGAPTAAQLGAQWRGLRDKVIALDAPAAGSSFGDKFLAKAKGVFHVTWAGQGAQNSIGATVSRVDLALQRNDLAVAVAACDDFPAVAKNVVADWQTAATQRLKADAAARALVSDSISAIGRSSSQ